MLYWPFEKLASKFILVLHSEQSELEKADLFWRDNVSSFMLLNGRRPKCLYRAISGRPYLHFARKMADGRPL